MTIQVTIPLEETDAARIDEIAAARGETRPKVLADAVRDYLHYDADFRAAVQEGIEAADRGEVEELADVEARLRAHTAQRVSKT